MHTPSPDRAPRNEITSGLLTIQADALFAYAQITEAVAGGGTRLVHTTPTETGQVESLHLVVPVGENQINMNSMSRDGRTASQSRTVRRLLPVALHRTTSSDGVSYRIVNDPANEKPGTYGAEIAHWSDADPTPQVTERGYVKAGPTLNDRPLTANERADVWDILTGNTPYDPAKQSLLSGRQGDKLIKNNVWAGMRRLLGKTGQVMSEWSEN